MSSMSNPASSSFPAAPAAQAAPDDTVVMDALPPDCFGAPPRSRDAVPAPARTPRELPKRAADVVDWNDACETEVFTRAESTTTTTSANGMSVAAPPSPAQASAAPASTPDPASARSAPSRFGRRLVAGAAFFAVATCGVGALARKHVDLSRASGAVAEVARPADEGTRVVVAPAEVLPAGRALALTGEVRPIRQVTLYAKVSGYLKEARFDKGDAVAEGQVLGVLENPDGDHRIAAAQAELSVRRQAAKRSRALSASGVTADADHERSDADLAIASAELSRAATQKGYASIRAPFAGTITARYADPGALLQAATSSSQAALPLAELSDLRTVRITVFVGQGDAPFVREGTPATIWTDAQPKLKVDARITRTTKALDPRTRTLQCEIELANPDGHFTAGSAVHVDLVAASPAALAVPVEGVFAHRGKPSVMIIRDGKAVLTPVEPGDHDGKRVRILSGLAEGDLVALGAGHDLANGAKIIPVKKPAPPGGPPPGR